MWDPVAHPKHRAKSTKYFLQWMDGDVLTSAHGVRAKETLLAASQRVPVLREFEHTPQGAPWHCEGMVVARHIERILAGLYAVEAGADLTHVEELARHRSLLPEIIELQETIREHAATLQAYALLHDLGKIKTISFEAPNASRGAAEGFVQHRHRTQAQASPQERAVYLKLARAFAARRPTATSAQAMGAFFDAYEIKTHFYGHAQASVGEEFLQARETICDWLRLTQRERRLLAFCIRHHIDAVEYFGQRIAPKKALLLHARANHAGLDADDAMDLLAAALFLDVSVGSVHYEHGVYEADLRPVVNLFLSEAESIPARALERRQAQERVRRKAFKDLLRASHLEPDVLFALLKVPHGPERGNIMNMVEYLVSHPDEPIDFGAYTNDLAPRIRSARAGFDPDIHLVRE